MFCAKICLFVYLDCYITCRSVILACLFSLSLSCFVRRHNLIPSISMLRLTVSCIQLLLLASFHAIMNLALACFNVVLLSNYGATSARFLAVVNSLSLLFTSLFQYGLWSFLAPFGIHSFAAWRPLLLNYFITILISLSYTWMLSGRILVRCLYNRPICFIVVPPW